MRADGDSAGADEQVRFEASLERGPMEARLVGNGLESRHLGTALSSAAAIIDAFDS